MQQHVFSTLTALSLILQLSAAQAQAVNPPFKADEKLVYSVLWKGTVKAGELRSQVTSLNPATGKVVFKAVAESSFAVSLFYSTYYDVVSKFDLSRMASEFFSLHGHERGDYKDQTETFNYTTSKGQLDFSVHPKDVIPNPKKTLQPPYGLTTNVNDVLSLIYYSRAASLPTTRGSKQTIHVIYEGTMWSTTFQYLDSSKKARLDGVVYSVNRYRLHNQNLTDPNDKNDSTVIWVANDPAKSLVKFSAKVQVGDVVAELRKSTTAKKIEPEYIEEQVQQE